MQLSVFQFYGFLRLPNQNKPLKYNKCIAITFVIEVDSFAIANVSGWQIYIFFFLTLLTVFYDLKNVTKGTIAVTVLPRVYGVMLHTNTRFNKI